MRAENHLFCTPDLGRRAAGIAPFPELVANAQEMVTPVADVVMNVPEAKLVPEVMMALRFSNWGIRGRPDRAFAPGGYVD